MEAIGQDDGFAPEELLGFAGGELADGSEDVGLVCGELLYLVLGFDTELACHLVAVVGIHIGIELLVIPRDRAADGRGVGDEECTDAGSLLSQVEETHSGLPLVEDSDGALIAAPGGDAGHEARGGDTEETTLVIVPIALVALEAIGLPQLEVEIILLLPQGLEVHEEYGGLTLDTPATCYDTQTEAREDLLQPALELGDLSGGEVKGQRRTFVGEEWPDKAYLCGVVLGHHVCT